MPKDYKLTAWANGFGTWLCRIDFTTPLGNTGEADRVAANAMRAAKRRIRQEIQARQGQPIGRLNFVEIPTHNHARPKTAFVVVANETEPGIGRLMSLTIAEK